MSIKEHILKYLTPVMVQKYEITQFSLHLTAFVANVHKRGTNFDIFNPTYGP